MPFCIPLYGTFLSILCNPLSSGHRFAYPNLTYVWLPTPSYALIAHSHSPTFAYARFRLRPFSPASHFRYAYFHLRTNPVVEHILILTHFWYPGSFVHFPKTYTHLRPVLHIPEKVYTSYRLQPPKFAPTLAHDPLAYTHFRKRPFRLRPLSPTPTFDYAHLHLRYFLSRRSSNYAYFRLCPLSPTYLSHTPTFANTHIRQRPLPATPTLVWAASRLILRPKFRLLRVHKKTFTYAHFWILPLFTAPIYI